MEQLILELRRRGLRDGDIAHAAGTDAVTVAGWVSEQAVGGEAKYRLLRLHHLADLLGETLTGPGPGQWLRSPNRLLGGESPLAVLGEGDGYVRVHNSVMAYLEGGYV